jgi:hypothetical protein
MTRKVSKVSNQGKTKFLFKTYLIDLNLEDVKLKKNKSRDLTLINLKIGQELEEKLFIG